MKNMKSIALTLALFSLVLSVESARATCWDAMCLNYTPVYNQMSTTIPASWFEDGDRGKSMLCAPTSAAMSLQGLIDDLKDDKVFTSGWTKNSFAGKSMANQIIAMATKMGTSIKDGTGQGSSVGVYSGTAGDLNYTFPGLNLTIPMGNSAVLYMASINLASYIQKFRSEEVRLITSYGHYNDNPELISTPTLKQRSVSYIRNGGHVIAPRGYVADSLFVNDPWGGVVYFSPLVTMLPKNQTSVSNGVTLRNIVTLPGGVSQASMMKYKQSAGYFPILEAMTTVGAPFAD